MLPHPPFPSQTRPLLTSDEVATHEGLGELFREAVLGVPQGPAILVKVLPEVRQRYGECVLVGVLALKLVQHKGTERRNEARRSAWRKLPDKKEPRALVCAQRLGPKGDLRETCPREGVGNCCPLVDTA